MKTTVVNIRTHKYDVYIGREGHGQDGCFGNPFSVARDGGRERVIVLYREYLLKRLRVDQEFARRIEGLRGKRLGCFCKPKACHGDVIVEYLNSSSECKSCSGGRGCSHIQPMVKVVVCGSRFWLNQDIIRKRLLELQSNTIVIEGGCGGADLLARNIALDIGLEVVEFPAAWKKYDKAAGPIRNIKMLDTKPSLVIAFHDDLNSSKGTKHIVTEARKRGIETEVIGSSAHEKQKNI